MSEIDNDDWQPLASIPTDGSLIDVWANGRESRRVKWYAVRGVYAWRTEASGFTDDIGTPTNWKRTQPRQTVKIDEAELPY